MERSAENKQRRQAEEKEVKAPTPLCMRAEMSFRLVATTAVELSCGRSVWYSSGVFGGFTWHTSLLCIRALSRYLRQSDQVNPQFRTAHALVGWHRRTRYNPRHEQTRRAPMVAESESSTRPGRRRCDRRAKYRGGAGSDCARATSRLDCPAIRRRLLGQPSKRNEVPLRHRYRNSCSGQRCNILLRAL
jgi:hypothetical protein